MANAARRDLASRVRFACRRVTRVAAVVRRKVRRNRQREAAIRRRVTAVAALLWTSSAGRVLRVIESDVETFVESSGEILQRRIAALRVGMADQTHRNRRRRELSAMTIGAGFVAGKTRRRGVVGSFVTRVAGEGTVPLARVQKLRVIDLRALSEHKECNTDHADNHLMSLRLNTGRSAIR